MSISQRMKKFDPYSTPARRRRIIADLSKVTLRQLYITGCDNVHRFRIQTKASIVLQCFIRQALARRRLLLLRFQLRTQMALKIQCRYRMYHAIKFKKHLRKERLLMQQKRLVKIVEHLWEIRKAKLYRAALLVARRLAKEKRRLQAARDIQRIFRGYSCRQIFKHRFYQKRLRQFRCKFAAILIQKNIRRWRCQLRFRRLQLWNRSAHKITTIFIRYRYHRQRERKRVQCARAALTIQCWFRRMQAIRKRRFLQHERLMRIPRYEITHQPLEIQVELSPKALGLFASRQVDVFVQWCLQQCLLQFSPQTGYQSGSVVRQVIASVERVQNKQQESYQHRHTSQKAIDIEVDAWDYSSNTQSEEQNTSQHIVRTLTSPMPSDWEVPIQAKKCRPGNDRSDENSSTEVNDSIGDEICFKKIIPCSNEENSLFITCLQLHIRSLPVTVGRNDSVRPPIIYQKVNERTIRFVPVMTGSLKSLSLDEDTTEDLASLFLEEAVFRFQNAMVYVPVKPLPIPMTALVSGDDEVTDSTEEIAPEIVRNEEINDIVEQGASIIEDSNIVAAIRIHLSTPSPPPIEMNTPSPPKPPPINYGHMARRIQKKYLQRRRCRHEAVTKIQVMQRRYWRLEKWRNLVYDYWEQCFDASVVIQCAFRVYCARKQLNRLRYEKEEWYFPFGHDFENSSERDNWRAFGMVLPDLPLQELSSTMKISSAFQEFCGPTLCLDLTSLCESEVTRDCLFSSMPGGSEYGSLGDINITQPPVFQLVQKLDVPDMPPNCLFPQSWLDTFVLQDLGTVGANDTNGKSSRQQSTNGRKVRFNTNDEQQNVPSDSRHVSTKKRVSRSSSTSIQNASTYESMLLTHFLSGPSPLVCYSDEMDKDLGSQQILPSNSNTTNGTSSGTSLSQSSQHKPHFAKNETSQQQKQRSTKLSKYSVRGRKQCVQIRHWQSACWGTPLSVIKNRANLSIPVASSTDSLPSESENPIDNSTGNWIEIKSNDQSLQSQQVSTTVTESVDNTIFQVEDEAKETICEDDGWEDIEVDSFEQELQNVIINSAEEDIELDDSLFVFGGWLDGSVTDSTGQEFTLLPTANQISSLSITSSSASVAPMMRSDPPASSVLFPVSFYQSNQPNLYATDHVSKKQQQQTRRPLTGKLRPEQRSSLQSHTAETSTSSVWLDGKWKKLRWMHRVAPAASSPTSRFSPNLSNRTKTGEALDYHEDKEDDFEILAADNHDDREEVDEETLRQRRERRRRVRAVQSLQSLHLLTPVYTSLAQHGV